EHAAGFNAPVDIQNAGDDRLFVVEQGGAIQVVQSDGSTNGTPFLDIQPNVQCCGESGLLGLAFHPDYATNGFFYVNYIANNGNTQVSRFSVSAGNPDVADPNSEVPLLNFPQPFSNHNGGCLAFGPDGFLYIALGDGGSGGDPGNRAQNLMVLYGKMLRIDVDNPSGGNNYGIPADNPYVGDPNGRDEIWSYGLRNPWKFSFDFVTGDIWIADVGQNAIEEINKRPATDANLNYGWRCYEGNDPFNTTGCPPQNTLTFPIAQYPHSVGQSITGGYAYQGTEYPNSVGVYFFADFVTGIIGTVDQNDNLVNHGDYNGNWSTFGEGNDNTLYIADYSGTISKITDTSLGTPQIDVATISFHPNPASNVITFSIENDTLQKIEIYDVKGAEVFSAEMNAEQTTAIDISNIPTGIYLVRTTSKVGGVSIKKLAVN
ncbi:MAG: PQQ-dependent sugar dehydrogenase, partial [Marinirhabdus sp.]